MAAGVLPGPGAVSPASGEEIGPCVDACKHRDCAATREMAAASCRFCVKPIGYDVRFYREGNGSGLVHASCWEDDLA